MSSLRDDRLVPPCRVPVVTYGMQEARLTPVVLFQGAVLCCAVHKIICSLGKAR
jgi:hypothetical protein